MRLLAVTALSALAAIAPAPVLGEQVLFQTAELGPTGVTAEQLNSGEVPGLSLGFQISLGARFQIPDPVVTTEVGGHFSAILGGGGSFFGAIVELDGPNDLPNSDDLSTPDVLGTAPLLFPDSSADAYGELSLFLPAGWYGVVFAGNPGIDGLGAMPLNNPSPGPINGFSRQDGLPWFTNPPALFDGARFVVRGSIVPEPSLLTLASIAVCSYLVVRR